MDLPRPFPGSAFSEYYSPPQLYTGYSGSAPGGDIFSRAPPYQPSQFDVTTGQRPTPPVLPGNHAAGIHGNMSETGCFPKPTIVTSSGDAFMASSPWTPSSWATSPGKAEVMLGPLSRSVMTSSGVTSQVTPHHHTKRKRKTTPQQRVAANIRERRRMCNLNSAFDRLRRRVPAFPHEKRLSRIQTLKLAITYIGFMTEIVSGQDIQTLLKQNAETNKHIVWQPYELGDSDNESGFI